VHPGQVSLCIPESAGAVSAGAASLRLSLLRGSVHPSALRRGSGSGLEPASPGEQNNYMLGASSAGVSREQARCPAGTRFPGCELGYTPGTARNSGTKSEESRRLQKLAEMK